MLTEIEMQGVIRERLKQSATAKALAQELGVSPQYLNDVLLDRRSISQQMAERLGYRRRVVFEVMI